MNKKIKIGSRGSKLALIYAQKAKDMIIKNTHFNDDDIEIKKIVTEGDKFQNVRLSKVGGKGLFSSNLEKELLEKKIDIAVHALKDLPAKDTDGLIIDTFLKRNDPREILISNKKKKLIDLKPNSIIGTSSFRREFQIKNIRKDLSCKLIRGNIDTRVKKVQDGLYDAIILSYAGIDFLKMNDHISEIFSEEKFIPSAGQGTISLQCREDDSDLLTLLSKLNHKETYHRVKAERSVLKILEGDCETAVGAHATIRENKIILEAELFSLDGKQRFYEKKTSKIEDANDLGKEVGRILKKKSDNTYKK
jgi:hydroxymethylbilane synthase